MIVEPKITAFLPTLGPKQSKEFYCDILGLELISEDNFALEFKGKESFLRITIVNEFTPHPFTVLGLVVSDIESEVKALVNKGVSFKEYSSLEQDQFGIWTSPSKAMISWFEDPDGNLLSLTQYP